MINYFFQTLRIQLKDKGIKVIEVLMTVVDTPFNEIQLKLLLRLIRL
jgi:short-subunit dehydrogenase involved in D-alanine esterification of teichoic acids